MTFDVEGARKAGYSDAEIADFLGTQNSFDVQGARQSGYSDAEILSHLSPQKQEAVETAGNAALDAIRQAPRQLGLTARAGVTGVLDTLGILSNPIASTINLGSQALGSGFRVPFAGQTGEATADLLGLPKPESATERVAQKTSRLLAGVAGSGAIGTLAKQGGAGSAKLGGFLTDRFGQQLGAAAGAGFGEAIVDEAGGSPLERTAAGVVGSVLGGAAAGGAGKINDALRRSRPQDIDVRIERILSDSGIDWSSVPASAKASLRREIGSMLQAGKELDSKAVGRLLDFRTVGATPTRGTVSLDPVQITREKNLSKMLANSGADDLHSLPRIENANNRALIDATNSVGGRPVDPMQAGQDVIESITARDARFKGIENRLYDRAKTSAGRPIPLDGDAFVRQAYEKLAQENKGAFLPENIGKLLQDIRAGKMTQGGQEFDVPFNVDVIDNLKTTLAAASRGSADGNVRSAIKQVRDALESVPVAPVKRSFGGSQVVSAAQAKALQDADALPGKALRAYDRARSIARSRRNWQESAPAIEAALDGASPDGFVKKYLISDAASFSDVTKVAREVRRSPEASQAVRSAIVGHLKDKALNQAADEVGNFSQSAYNKALKQIERKLPVFFTSEEIESLKAIGRVASYTQYQPRGSAVNNSNSASNILGRSLDLIGGAAQYLPFGKQAISDPISSARLTMSGRAAQNVIPGLLGGEPPPLLSPQMGVPLGLLSTVAPPALE